MRVCRFFHKYFKDNNWRTYRYSSYIYKMAKSLAQNYIRNFEKLYDVFNNKLNYSIFCLLGFNFFYFSQTQKKWRLIEFINRLQIWSSTNLQTLKKLLSYTSYWQHFSHSFYMVNVETNFLVKHFTNNRYYPLHILSNVIVLNIFKKRKCSKVCMNMIYFYFIYSWFPFLSADCLTESWMTNEINYTPSLQLVTLKL